MNFASILNFALPAAIIGYAIYLLIRMRKNRKSGCSIGGCSGCPMSDTCRVIREKEQKEQHHNEPPKP